MISGIYSAGGTGGNAPGSQAEPSQNPQTAYYDLLDDGAYGLNIEGLWTIGPGPDAIPWAIWFEDSEAFLLADVQPTDGDSGGFHSVDGPAGPGVLGKGRKGGQFLPKILFRQLS